MFSRRRGVCPDPHVQLNNVLIPLQKEHKFLGVVLDEKLAFIPHIKILKQKYLKTINILKALAPFDWSKELLLRVFTSLVGSRLEY